MFGNTRTLVSVMIGYELSYTDTPSRRWQDYGCQLGEPEAGYGAKVGTLWKTENT